MSLKSPRLIAFAGASVAALTIVSCGQQPSPTSPSSFNGAAGIQPEVTEYWVTLSDETPAPATPPPPPAPGSPPSPWPPGPPPMAAPGVPVPTPPSTHPRISIRIDPGTSVLHSGVPVPVQSCENHPYTWYYDQHIIGETGVKVTFTERENFFDGRFTSKNTSAFTINGNASVVLHTRWCSAYRTPHFTQTRFKGVDEYGEKIEIAGPWIQLLTP
jgi:hypothetical protein